MLSNWHNSRQLSSRARALSSQSLSVCFSSISIYRNHFACDRLLLSRLSMRPFWNRSFALCITDTHQLEISQMNHTQITISYYSDCGLRPLNLRVHGVVCVCMCAGAFDYETNSSNPDRNASEENRTARHHFGVSTFNWSTATDHGQ